MDAADVDLSLEEFGDDFVEINHPNEEEFCSFVTEHLKPRREARERADTVNAAANEWHRMESEDIVSKNWRHFLSIPSFKCDEFSLAYFNQTPPWSSRQLQEMAYRCGVIISDNEAIFEIQRAFVHDNPLSLPAFI